MKIAFVIDDGLDSPDGVQQYILSLGSQFASMGHEVIYLAGETKSAPKNAMVYSLAKNIKVEFNGNKLSVPLPVNSKKIKEIIDSEQPDIIHVQIPHSPFFGAKVIKVNKTAGVVGTFHILPYGKLSRYGTKLLGIALSRNLKKFNEFISVSKPAQQFAGESFGIKSQVVPNMVNLQRFRGNGQAVNTNLKVLFLGRLVQRKGCMQLLKALAILKSGSALSKDIDIDLCGDGPMRQELESYAVANGIAENIRFHGFVSDIEKIEFMRNADVSIFPSISGESFGIVLIEAMAAGGGIVLGGNNPGYESVLSQVPGSIIDVGNIDKMAKQLDEIFSDKQKRQIIYDAQQTHVLQFDSKTVARQVLSIYNACKNSDNS